jgi:hypothetical protein
MHEIGTGLQICLVNLHVQLLRPNLKHRILTRRYRVGGIKRGRNVSISLVGLLFLSESSSNPDKV